MGHLLGIQRLPCLPSGGCFVLCALSALFAVNFCYSCIDARQCSEVLGNIETENQPRDVWVLFAARFVLLK